MLFRRLCQILIRICLQMTQVSLVNIRTLQKAKMFLIKNLRMYAIALLKKLSIYFGEGKTKCILFRSDKNLPEVNITYNNIRIKQYRLVEYLGFLDANLIGDSMAMKSLRKTNKKLQFLYRQNEFLKPKLRRLLCNYLFNSTTFWLCLYFLVLIDLPENEK